MPDGSQYDGVIRLKDALERGAGAARSGGRRRKGSQQQVRGLPVVKVGGGLLPFAIDQAEATLIECDKNLFQRGDFIVRPAPIMVDISDNRQTCALRLVPVKIQNMIERLTRVVDFQRFDARSDAWLSIDCPPNVAAAYLERIGQWNLPILSGITNAPTLRPDGSILDKPGFDVATGILYDPRGINYSEVPREPTRQDALEALDRLKGLISEFPFVPDDPNATAANAPSANRSVALSAMLTPLIRRSVPRAPVHAFTAPAMGTGKSKLVDLASMIACGHEALVLAQGKTEEEMEKRLGAALIAGDALISFDNCEHPIGGELLCQAVTQPTLSIRILGKSANVMVKNNAAIFATGNNLAVIGDMTRRTLVCALDARIERPETRTFKTEDPVEIVRRDRAAYVIDVLTILRAYYIAGRPNPSDAIGSFESWSAWVRDALVWLGEPDPWTTASRARAEDPRMQELAAVLHQWSAVLGKESVTVKQVIEKATDYYREAGILDFNKRHFLHPEFREALLVVAGDGGTITSRRLGTWLGRRKSQVVGGLRLDPDTPLNGDNRWRVVALE